MWNALGRAILMAFRTIGFQRSIGLSHDWRWLARGVHINGLWESLVGVNSAPRMGTAPGSLEIIKLLPSHLEIPISTFHGSNRSNREHYRNCWRQAIHRIIWIRIRQIAIEISLFCSVLKQLQSTLAKAKAFRYSLSAIETTQEILDRCQEVFNEIEGIVNSLRKGGGERSPEATQDWVVRIKWTFKRSQVQLLRSTLESCKVTLHIMLSTLDFAQKIATRRLVNLRS